MGIDMRGRPEAGVTLPRRFLTETLPEAPAEHSVILLYAYGLCAQGDRCTIQGIAQAFGRTEEAVREAFCYWKRRGLVQWDETTEDLILQFEETSPQTDSPTYPPSELAVYLERSPELRNLFLNAQKLLGRLLTQRDMEQLFGFYDWLHLPIEVIDVLLQYCAEREQRNLAYMEKVAIAWAEAGIDTPEKALAHTDQFSSGYREVCRAFGIRDRGLTPAEETYVRKWRQQWQTPLPLITRACEKTVLQTGKVNFRYADKILDAWHQAGAKTAEDVEKLDAARKQAAKAKPKAPAAPKRTNRFVNFEQRDLDFELLEQVKRTGLERKTGGGTHGE